MTPRRYPISIVNQLHKQSTGKSALSTDQWFYSYADKLASLLIQLSKRYRMTEAQHNVYINVIHKCLEQLKFQLNTTAFNDDECYVCLRDLKFVLNNISTLIQRRIFRLDQLFAQLLTRVKTGTNHYQQIIGEYDKIYEELVFLFEVLLCSERFLAIATNRFTPHARYNNHFSRIKLQQQIMLKRVSNTKSYLVYLNQHLTPQTHPTARSKSSPKSKRHKTAATSRRIVSS